MTHLIEILLITGLIASVIMLMVLIILKAGITVTSRPLTKEEIEKLENRKWPWKRKPKVEDSSESTMPTESSETDIEPTEVVESYAEKEQTAIKSLLDTISKDAGIDSKCSFYRKRFLKCKRVPNRSHVYIDRSSHECMKRFLSIAAPDTSMAGYVSRIIKDHIAENATTINKIFEDSKTKLF